MATAITISLDTREFKKWARKAPKRFDAALRRALPRAGYLYSNIVKRKMSGPVLKRRTGNLVRSVTVGKVQGARGNLSLSVGTNLVYAPIHEYGGTIRPKKGKYLTIPLDAAKTAAGVARFSARNAPGKTFVAESKKGNLIIFRKDATRITPLFVLKKKVIIPERPIWRPSVPEVTPAFQKQVIKEVSGEMRRS